MDIDSEVLIREFNENKDTVMVGKLEKNCEIGSTNGASIPASTIGDPLCRIRFYPLHVMLVAELHKTGELVGVVRGCIKHVGTGFVETSVKLGCTLGLRISPRHRRVGIGLRLIKALEDWMMRNGAEYILVATEKSNIAAMNLFTVRCHYVIFSSLVIYVQPAKLSLEDRPQDIKIEKLCVDQAISLYRKVLQRKDIYPADIDVILRENLSLGTWVSYVQEDECIGPQNKERNEHFMNKNPNSWIVFSLWNSCEAYKLQMKKSYGFNFFLATMRLVRRKLLSCLELPNHESFEEPFGFLFLYGFHGEGQRLGELMKSIWNFAAQLAENIKDCSMILTELGVMDPLREHVHFGSSTVCIDDVWCIKKVSSSCNDTGGITLEASSGNVFVDPRDF